jgi:membrane dipeptidase
MEIVYSSAIDHFSSTFNHLAMLIIDSHLDLAYNALEWNRDILQPVEAIRASEKGMTEKGRQGNTVSIPALREGNFGLCFVTVHCRIESCEGRFKGVRTQDIAYSKAQGELAFYRLLQRKGILRQVDDLESLNQHLSDWESKPDETPIGFVLTMEGADPVVDPDQVGDWWEQGLRSISLVHYGISSYAHGTHAPGGLLPRAKPLLQAMEEVGMILDISHMAEGTFYEALDIFNGPLMATHNCCHVFVPDERQLKDEQIKILAERDAVIGVAFDAWMLVPNFDKDNPDPSNCTLETVANNIDHICQIAGNANHAAIGTDLDGGYGNEQTPSDVETIADLQKLPEILKSRGYSDGDVSNVMHGNWIRRLRTAWAGRSEE